MANNNANGGNNVAPDLNKFNLNNASLYLKAFFDAHLLYTDGYSTDSISDAIKCLIIGEYPGKEKENEIFKLFKDNNYKILLLSELKKSFKCKIEKDDFQLLEDCYYLFFVFIKELKAKSENIVRKSSVAEVVDYFRDLAKETLSQNLGNNVSLDKKNNIFKVSDLESLDIRNDFKSANEEMTQLVGLVNGIESETHIKNEINEIQDRKNSSLNLNYYLNNKREKVILHLATSNTNYSEYKEEKVSLTLIKHYRNFVIYRGDNNCYYLKNNIDEMKKLYVLGLDVIDIKILDNNLEVILNDGTGKIIELPNG